MRQVAHALLRRKKVTAPVLKVRLSILYPLSLRQVSVIGGKIRIAGRDWSREVVSGCQPERLKPARVNCVDNDGRAVRQIHKAVKRVEDAARALVLVVQAKAVGKKND